MKYEKYKRDSEISYSLGSFPTFELVSKRPDVVECVLYHSKLIIGDDIKKLFDLCKKHNIKVINDDKQINKLADKDNCFVIGVFRKYASKIIGNRHVVLDNPSDMGNLGTIIRTMLGFGLKDLVVTTPCADYFNPKVVRASMGAVFSLNIVEFPSIDDYIKSNDLKKYFFMLKGKKNLGSFVTPADNYALVFGNEARGLKDSLLDEGESVVIKHTNNIDSLNLPISVGMAIYEFNHNLM